MLRLGEVRDADDGKMKVWLTKWIPTGEYQILQFRREWGGWVTGYAGTLKEARAYARRNFNIH